MPMNDQKYPNPAAAFLLLASLGFSCSVEHYPDEALSPEDALKCFEIREGFGIEPFAAEPHVMDPVDMVFDETGNIYVVEMGDYPYKPEQGQGKGKIKMLMDEDGDGRIDTAVVFADGIADATSALPWEGGLIVTAAPDILFLKDTTGDFRADVNEVLFTGFFEHNSEAQITSLRFGVDNWIYANNNGQPGEVRFNRDPDAPPLSVGGGDFRFRLDRGKFEVESGNGQFGLAIDDWGNRFFTQNTLHIQHAPIPWRYLHRHEHLPSYNVVSNIYAHDLRVYQKSQPPYWRVERSTRRQQRYDEQNLNRTEHIEGHFTGASGGTFYAGDAFPASFYGSVFTAEVACNLVHRDVLAPLGKPPFFVARRDSSELKREFLTSTDPWFRPVNFSLGPDGNLYLLDMYRQHIETPVSIPEDLKEDMDFLHGNRYGRIYRIFPENKKGSLQVAPNLRETDAPGLVKLLSHPNRWWRLHAQRLLLERQDKSVTGSLTKLFSEHEDPRTRLHALYALEGMDALNPRLVKQAMRDAHWGVRKHGAILAERYPECLSDLRSMQDDPSAQVVFQAALSLGEFPGQQVMPALARVIAKYQYDPGFSTAVLSSEAGSSLDLLKLLEKNEGFFQERDKDKTTFLETFSFVVASRNRQGEIVGLLDLVRPYSTQKGEEWLQAALAGVSKGLKNAGTENGSDPDLDKALSQLQDDAGSAEIDTIVAEIRKTLDNK